jgi:hypothetical protein
MFPPGRHEERFFDDAHADNLYSPAGLVKLESAPFDELVSARYGLTPEEKALGQAAAK